MKMIMKSALLAAIVLGFTAMPALAQNDDGGGPGGGQGGGPGPGGGGQRFEARKAAILERIKQREACVEAATDPESLRACMGGGGGRGGRGGGGGGGQDDGGGDDGGDNGSGDTDQ